MRIYNNYNLILLNKINRDTWRTLPQFHTLKIFLDKIKEVFVNSPARRGRYIAYLKMHGISSPCKIPLYNKTRWNSWFRIVNYTKDHIITTRTGIVFGDRFLEFMETLQDLLLEKYRK